MPQADQVAERLPGFARIRVVAPLGDRVVTTDQPTFIWADVPPCRRINLIVFEGTDTASDSPFRTFYDLPPSSTSFSVPENDRWPDGTYTYFVIADSSDREVGSSGEVRFSVRNCPADINRSGSVTIEDVYAFFNAWLAGRDPRTNQPRVMTVDDVLAYINEWYAGCR